MREREREGEVEGSNLIGKTGEGEERRRKGHGTRVTGWNSFRGKASDSVAGCTPRGRGTIDVCARFGDPGSISRQIEFFLKIKERDI